MHEPPATFGCVVELANLHQCVSLPNWAWTKAKKGGTWEGRGGCGRDGGQGVAARPLPLVGDVRQEGEGALEEQLDLGDDP